MMKMLILGFLVVVALTIDDKVDGRFNPGNRVGYIWHITDPHTDKLYKTGTDPDCPHEKLHPRLCCQELSKNQTRKAGMFGTPDARCDVPLRTYQGCLSFMKLYQSEKGFSADAVIWTGDAVPHDKKHQTRDTVIDYYLTNLKMISDTLGENITVLHSIGNLDGHPPYMLGHPPLGNWLIDPIADTMSHYQWVSAGDCVHFRKKGYYSTYLIENRLKVISINTQWTNKWNWFVFDYELLPHHEMTTWLESELSHSQAADEKVIIIGHIPQLSASEVFKKWNEDYLALLRKFNNTILIQLYGHRHADQFQIARASDNTPVAVSLLSSSITTFGGKNPVVRLISYPKNSPELRNSPELEILDVQTFYNDLRKSNADQRMDLHWNLEYSMREAYELPDFSAGAFDRFVGRMERNETLFGMYFKYLHGSFAEGECTGKCRIELLCQAKYTSLEKLQKCIESSDE